MCALAALWGLLTLAAPALAELVSAGPDVTLDTESDLEWLAPTQSLGLSFAEVEAGVGGFTGDGWRHATIGEVCALFERYLVPAFPPALSCPIVGFDFPTIVTTASATAFLLRLGSTGHSDGQGGFGTRAYADGASPPEVGTVMLGNPTYYAGVTVNGGDTPDSASATTGHFLVREASVVAVPGLPGWGGVLACTALLWIAMGRLGVRRRRADPIP